jgi:hypothetical protein
MWLDELRHAIRANLSDPRIRELAARRAWGLRDAVAWVRTRIPYRYDGPWAHRIVSLAGVELRGYGACGDGAALIAAVGLLRNLEGLSLCIEQLPNVAQYGHVRIVHRHDALEPWPERRWEVPACSGLVDVRELVG